MGEVTVGRGHCGGLLWEEVTLQGDCLGKGRCLSLRWCGLSPLWLLVSARSLTLKVCGDHMRV